MVDRRKQQNYQAFPEYLTETMWVNFSRQSQEKSRSMLLQHLWNLGMRCPSESSFAVIFNLLHLTSSQQGAEVSSFAKYQGLQQVKKEWKKYKIAKRHEDFLYIEYLEEPEAQSALATEIMEPTPVEPEESVPAQDGEPAVKVSLDEGLERLQEALEQRDSNKPKPASQAGARPKVKASPKGKAKVTPASKKKPAAPKSKTKVSKQITKKAAAKSKVAKPRKGKTSQAKEYKMTRECVYSRAYHQAASNLAQAVRLWRIYFQVAFSLWCSLLVP
eukprot:s792_g34.t1